MTLHPGDPGHGADHERAAEYERLFARTFVEPHRCHRFLEIASARRAHPGSDAAGRKRWARHCQAIAGLEHWLRGGVLQSGRRIAGLDAEAILRSLAAEGAPDDCYRMAMDRSTDGRFLRLADAVDDLTSGDNESVLLVCAPDRLACYWHGEVADLSTLLRVGEK